MHLPTAAAADSFIWVGGEEGDDERKKESKKEGKGRGRNLVIFLVSII